MLGFLGWRWRHWVHRVVGSAGVALVLVAHPSQAAELCEQHPICRKLFSSAQKHSAQLQHAEAQSELERALALTQDGHLLSPLSESLLAQRKTDQAVDLYTNFLAKLPSGDPSRELLSRELQELLLRPELSDSTVPLRESNFTLPVEPEPKRPCPWSSGRRLDVRIAGITLLGLGAVGLTTGGLLLPQAGDSSDPTDCAANGPASVCHQNTKPAAIGMFVVSGIGVLSGAALLGLSFKRSGSVPCQE